jgi:hypothetical protein
MVVPALPEVLKVPIYFHEVAKAFPCLAKLAAPAKPRHKAFAKCCKFNTYPRLMLLMAVPSSTMIVLGSYLPVGVQISGFSFEESAPTSPDSTGLRTTYLPSKV